MTDLYLSRLVLRMLHFQGIAGVLTSTVKVMTLDLFENQLNDDMIC